MSNKGKKRPYRVLVNGQNYWLNIDGRPQWTGFYTTRFVEAHNAEEAKDIAVEMILADSKLSKNLNDASDQPILSAEEVEAVDVLERAHGYAFYSEEGDEN